MMATSAAGRQLITEFEGNVLTAYQDSVGVWTIGVGHTAAAGPPIVTSGMTITAAQSDSILADDLKQTEGQVSSAVTVPVAQNEFDAMVSLCFNIGRGNFRTSTVVRELNQGNRPAAGDAFLLWNKAGGNVLAGLTKRRNRERTLFLTGQY